MTFAAGQNSEIGRYDVPCEESLSGLGMGMTNAVFQIEGIRLNLKESLKRAVRYSVALGPRFIKWMMLNRSGSKALLLLQLLIALVTIVVVNIGAVSCDIFLASLDTYRVSCEEECMPNFDVENCLLNLLAMSFGGKVGFSLKTIASFSACWYRLAINCLNRSPQFRIVCLVVHGLHDLLPFGLLVCGRCSSDFFI